MNINGVYGNTIAQAKSDKVASTTTKNLLTTSIDYNTEMLSSVPENEFLTYEDQIKIIPENQSEEGNPSEEDSLKNSSQTMTEEDYKDLSEEGISLEKYNIERLDRALERIKEQRVLNQESIETMKQKIDEKVQSLINIKNVDGLTKKVVKKLLEADMPVTESNILKIANAMGMAQTLTQITDKSMVYMIKNNLSPTVENIYKAQYSGIYTYHKEVSDETWKQLQNQVNDIITNSGLELTSENMESAKWLLQNNLPVTKDTITTLYDLSNLKKGMDEDQVIENMVDSLSKGKGPEAASISTYIQDQVEKSIEGFLSISDEAVDYIITNNSFEVEQINLKVLQQAQGDINKQKTDSNKDNQKQDNIVFLSKVNNSELDIKSITVRRQLEEIRLKLTVESGGQLLKKGIHIETDNLSKIIDGLKEIEDTYYHNLLKEGEVEVNPNNLELLKDCINSIDELKTAPNYILGSTLSSRKIQTVDGLITEGNIVKQNLEKMNESYEVLMTKPRSDMGDSILKAFRNVDAILEDMKLETTSANQRAVRILGYNSIDINVENINHVKTYDEQVNYMMKNFHPAVATHLIKTGINPLNMPIEELNKCIDQVKTELGVSGEEKYSKFLFKLEKDKDITEEERKSFIGIYRLLNNVDKTGGAALGSVLKANQEVTMNTLLTALRTIKSGGIQVNVDDNFGALETLTFTRDSITNQIETAFPPISDTENNNTNNSDVGKYEENYEYNNLLLKRLFEEIEPHKLQSMGSIEEIINMPIDKLMDTLYNQVENDGVENNGVENNGVEKDFWMYKLQELKESLGSVDDSIKLLKDYQIPTTIQNVQCANDMLHGDQSFYSQWKKQLDKTEDNGIDEVVGENHSTLQNLSDRLLQCLTSKSSMLEQYNRVEQDVNKVLNKLYENPGITSQVISNLQRISNGFSFLTKLASRESYELPMVIGDKITNVTITFIKNTEKSGKIDINIKSENLGNIKVDIQVKDNSIKGLITCENRKTLEALVAGKENLESDLSKNGVSVKYMNYGIINSKLQAYQSKNLTNSIDNNTEDSEEKIETNQLYNIGKIVLTNIKILEETNPNTYAV